MKINNQAIRRRQLDRQLLQAREVVHLPRPVTGYVKAIRESLGMTLETFGNRLGVTRATAHQIEKAEQAESITLKRLRSAANALECDLVVTLVPRQSLETTITERAYKLAKKEFATANHSMLLEGQAVYDADAQDLIEQIAQDLIDENDPRLWTSE
jgi:predicted DNA-binding mobile mystery protein A